MDKQLFDDAIGTAPLSTVDVEAVIEKQRRAARVRVVANPWVATVAAVVAVAAVVWTLPGASGNAPADPTGDAGPTSESPIDCLEGGEGMPTAPATPEDPAATSTRLTNVLRAALEANGPGLIWESAEPTFSHVFREGSRINDHSCMSPEDVFAAEANTADALGVGSLWIRVGRDGGQNELPKTCDQSESAVSIPPYTCTARTGPNGETIVIWESDDDGVHRYRVNVTKADGTTVLIDSHNVPLSRDGVEINGPTRPEAPLSIEQTIAVAVDPGLTMYSN